MNKIKIKSNLYTNSYSFLNKTKNTRIKIVKTLLNLVKSHKKLGENKKSSSIIDKQRKGVIKC